MIKNALLYLRKAPAIIKRDILKTPVINYFGTNYKRNILLSYITKPFRRGPDLTHTNMVEAIEIAKILNELEYNVDIVDYDYEGYLDQSKYNVIFGFGEPFVKNFYERKTKIVSIYYATGMSIETQNYNTLKRVEEFYYKKGVYLPSSARLYEKAWTIQTVLPDAIITLGNNTAMESFTKVSDKKIYTLNPSFIKIFDYKSIVNKRKVTDAKKNFLWFASSGMIHKGLDLLLDVFTELNYLHLHICAPLDNEPGFKEIYKSQLTQFSNIHSYGFISLKSPKFKELLTKCASIVYPSISEGGSPAVLNVCGNGGLIPIVSQQSTLDVDDFGYILNDLNSETIKNMIIRFSQADDSEIEEKSKFCGKEISEKYSLENFRINLKNIIGNILEHPDK